MLKNDTSNPNLLHDFFLILEDLSTIIQGLLDNTIYIICVTEEWGNAVVSLQHNIEVARFRDCWHYRFKAEKLEQDEVSLPENIRQHIGAGYNIIMPLCTPDVETKSYMMCKVDEPAHLELCAALMMVDAERIQDQSAMNAFVQLYAEDREKAFDEWSRMLDYKCAKPFDTHSVSFKGKYSSRQSKFPFLKHELDIPKNLKTDYEEHLARIMGISDTVKNLDKPQNDQELEIAEKDFQVICEGLKESEKNELILELSKAIPEERLKKIWQNVTDRKAKGQNSKMGIEVRMKLPVLDNGRPDRLQGDVRTYLVDQDGKYHLLNFANNTAHTIYVMNLLYYKRSNGELRSLDIRKNEQAFIELYGLIYSDNGGKDAFDKLMCRISNTEIDYEGRAKSRCFNSITNCITEKCRQLGADPSPYIIDDHLPLTLDYNLIKIAPKLEHDFDRVVFNE